jgi:putative FmdB family regulatory protein
MPTYDYACTGCGHRFERFEGIHDGGPKECPKCHKKKGRRMLGTGAGLIFKGSGFYTTDSKSSGRKEVKESKEGKEAKEEHGGGSKDGEKKEPAKEKKKEEKEQKK